jgi:myotubularin-related protein 3/4
MSTWMLQWLDCVHQLLLQFPCNFEFNLSFLVKLAQHTYSSMFGTFLCNALAERRRHRVSQKTRSVWDFLEHHHVKFRNFLYESRIKEAVEPLWPRCEVRDLLLWKDVYVVSDHKMSLSNTSPPTASSSGLNSRCEDAPPSVDAVDSSNSSREDDGNLKTSLPKMRQVHEELERLERSGSLPKDDNSEEVQVKSSLAHLKLGKAIESSTDTLVDSEERQQQNLSNPEQNVKPDQSSEERQPPTVVTEELPLPPLQQQQPSISAELSPSVNSPPCDAINPKIPSENGGSGNGGNVGCPSNCLMGCDLSQYFKEPIDSDGLTAHHNQIQERLVRIFASHQAEVQALRRDLTCTRMALFKHRSLSGRVNGAVAAEDLAVDIDAKSMMGQHVINGNSGSSSTGACSDASSTWEAIDEKEAKPTLWIPDHVVGACMK